MGKITIDISQVIDLSIYALEHENVVGALNLLRDASSALKKVKEDE